MSDKFAITAELQLRAGQNFSSQIDKIRDSFKPIVLSIDKSQFTKDIKSIKGSLKTLSEKGSISLNIDLKQFNKDVKYIHSTIQAVKTSINVDINKPYFDKEVLYVYKSIRAIKSSIEVGINKPFFDKDILYIYKSIRTLNSSLSNGSIALKIDKTKFNIDLNSILSRVQTAASTVYTFLFNANTSPAFDKIINDAKVLLNSSKNISFSVTAKINKSSLKSLTNIQNALGALSPIFAGFDANKAGVISSSIATLTQSLNTLSSVGKRNFKFNFSLKDVKFFDSVLLRINRLAIAFQKVTTNANSFAASIGNIRAQYQALFTLLKSNGNPFPKPPKVNTNTTTAGSGSNSIAKTGTATKQTVDAMEELGLQTAQTFKRFGAYTLATAGLFRLTFAIKDAISEFVEFDKELNKVQQVTGLSAKTTKILSDEVTRLATSYGVSSKGVLDTSLVLAQAGFSATQTKEALEALTQTELAATFDDINDTVEATIALMSQFGTKTSDLQKTLSSVNAVSAAFAVESKDITVAIQKTGGAFAAAGGDLNELIALFTSVRSTTRESADTIATGFRTIFTRLQRVRTQEFLRDFGVDLNYSSDEAKKFGKTAGEFVGPYEAIKRLSTVLNTISSTDPRFAQITEELGGFRQISKVIPLITQFSKTQQALIVATKDQNSLFKDAQIAQDTYANKLTKVREEFNALIRDLGNDKNIKNLVNTFLDLAKSLVSVLKYAKDLAVPLTFAAGLAASSAGAKIFTGFKKGLLEKTVTKANGGIVKMSRGGSPGGFIPGYGTRDDVPALLMKGEYVINNDAVKAIGVDTLDDINFRKHPKKKALGGRIGYANGGRVGYATGGIAKIASNPAALGIAGLVGLSLFEDNITKVSEDVKKLGLAFVSTVALLQVSNLVIATQANKLKDLTSAINQSGKAIQDYKNTFRDRAKKDKALQGFSDRNKGLLNPKVRQQAEADLSRFNTTGNNAIAAARQNRANILQYRQSNPGNANSTYVNQQIADFQNNLAIAAKSGRKARGARNFLNQTLAPIEQRRDQLQNSRDIAQRGQDFAGNRLRTIAQRRNGIVQTAKIGAGVAIVGSVANQFLQERADKQINSIREGSGGSLSSARNTIVGSGTLSTAAQFGAAGAIAGSALGPVGTAIGGAAGVIIGAAYGFKTSTEKFNEAVESLDIDKLNKDLSKRLEKFTSGKVTSDSIRGNVVSSINDIQRKLQSTSNLENRSDLKASLENNSVGVRQFVDDLARSSKSIEDFNSKIDAGSRSFISSILNLNLSEFEDTIKNTIETNKKAIEDSKKLNNANKLFLDQTKALFGLTQAFVFAKSEISTLSTTLKSFNDGQGQRAVSSFSVLNDGQVPKNVIPKVSSFTDQFGDAGKIIGDFATSALRAKDLLPDILIKIKEGGAFGSESDLTNTLSKELNNANIGGSIAKIIEAKLPGVLGGEFKDSEFFKKLDEDLPGVIDQLTNGFDNSFKVIQDAAEKSASLLNDFGDSLSELRKGTLADIVNQAAKKDTEASVVRSRDSFFQRPTSFNRLLGIQNQKDSILTGGSSAAQLVAQASGSRKNIIGLESQLKNTEDIQARKSLIESIDKERLILERANQGLETLADRSEKLSIIQEQLSKAQSDRSKVKDFVTGLVFGDKESRLNQTRVGFASNIVAQTGNINAVPEDLKGEILALFKTFGDTKLIGSNITGNQAIDKVLKNAGVNPNIVGPGKEEQNLQSLLEAEIKNGAAARDSLNQLLADDRKQLSTQLNTDFKTFLDNLNRNLKENQVNSINSNLIGTRSDLSRTQKDASFLSGLNKISPNAVANINDIVDINKQQKNVNPAILNGLDLAIKKSSTNIDRGGFTQTISFDKANDFISKSLEGLPQELINKIVSNIQSQDLGANFSNKTANAGKVEAAVRNQLTSTRQSLGSEFSKLQDRRSQIVDNVGGETNFNKLAARSEEYQNRLKDIENKNLQQLNATMTNLTLKINELTSQKKALGFNTGGVVPGAGNFDSVPARLTPGEVVIKKSSVAKYGPNMLKSINNGSFSPKGFANGGMVGEGNYIDAGSISLFSYAVQKLSNQVDRLEYIFKSIPTQINLNGTHTVEVIVTGAQVLNSIMPEIANLVERASKSSINKMLKQKFPTVGSFDG